jgi:hypothetical protein
MQIGSYDTNKMRDPSNLVWLEMPDDLMYWYNRTGGMKIGDEEYNFGKNYRAIMDTGTSLIILPGCKYYLFTYTFIAIGEQII